MSTEQNSLDSTTDSHQENCLFCRIASGELPSYHVYEDEQIKAFMDLHPIRPGHVLIIPKVHYDYYDDLPPELAASIVHLGQRLGKIMKATYQVERVAFMFTGIHVPHVHAHVVPMFEKTDITSPAYIEQKDLTFRSLAPRANEDELRSTAAALSSDLMSSQGRA